MIVRPYGIVLDGELKLGLEAVVEGGKIREFRPHTGIPNDFVLSPAFVNAHSHLEYRGLQGSIKEREYWPWIRRLTALKAEQDMEQVRRDCIVAAEENRATGVGFVVEHSDRPFAAEAMAGAGLAGIVLQELITFFEHSSTQEKWSEVERKRESQAAFGLPTHVAPHATYTVDIDSLRKFADGELLSIHVAETVYENEFFTRGEGPIADFYDKNGVPYSVPGCSAVAFLGESGLVRKGAQFVHCCALDAADIALIASSGVLVAHCPRSNEALGSPTAPIQELLDAGVPVGIGLDSAASSGPIDMFAEMRCAVKVSVERGKPVTPEEVWRMATSASAVPEQGSVSPGWIKIHLPGATAVEELLEARPAQVEWLIPPSVR